MATVMSFYDVLGVSPTANYAQLRTAFRSRALESHPDKGGSKEAFQLVQSAFEALSQFVVRAASSSSFKPGDAAAPCGHRSEENGSSCSKRRRPAADDASVFERQEWPKKKRPRRRVPSQTPPKTPAGRKGDVAAEVEEPPAQAGADELLKDVQQVQQNRRSAGKLGVVRRPPLAEPPLACAEARSSTSEAAAAAAGAGSQQQGLEDLLLAQLHRLLQALSPELQRQVFEAEFSQAQRLQLEAWLGQRRRGATEEEIEDESVAYSRWRSGRDDAQACYLKSIRRLLHRWRGDLENQEKWRRQERRSLLRWMQRRELTMDDLLAGAACGQENNTSPSGPR
eukprot:TRINITY_DN31044_c0_g1_i2.p1 TRINITY_DN31044_c0_g1~~TRINITY_DN31044_c0_g1_i2.p1  ORF type:complete len:339 (-),score=94.88 TRINITY_DN31044_c0_g1_i2:317-1333(-)